MSLWLSQTVLPGKRHVQDAAWLAQLLREGVARYFSADPEPPPVLFQGVEEFNRGSYWKAHETLESVWLQTEYPLRLWYYALIKLAVGFYHLERRNSRGARSQLRAALNFLEPFQPTFLGVRLDATAQECWQSAQVGQIRTREDYYYEELRVSSLRVLL